MSLENAKVLYKNFLALGRQDKADDVARGYPEIAVKPKEEPKEKPKEVKSDGKKPKR